VFPSVRNKLSNLDWGKYKKTWKHFDYKKVDDDVTNRSALII
jgi:hypothetical protein